MAIDGSGESELSQDARRGLSGPARDVAQVLHNLAKTTRSFGFYARDNAAISNFLEELRKGFDELLDNHGAIRLVVGADRFVWKSDVVYLNSDREKGLAFRLFRDGIRGFVFKPGLTEEELMALLDVLSRRQSTGRSTEEDDVVTLLWKLSLNFISYEAVEGFTHELHGSTEYEVGEDGERKRADSGQALPRMMERISGKRETLQRGRAARSFVDEDASAFLNEALGAGDDEAAGIGDGTDSDAGRRRGRKTPVRAGGDTAMMQTVDEDEAAAGPGAGAPLKAGLYKGASHYPLPLRGGMVEIQYDPLSWQEVAAIREELDAEQRTGIIHLLDYCFELCQQEAGYFEPDDFSPMVHAIRRYLLRGRDLATYDSMMRYLRRIAAGGIYPTYLTRRAAKMVEECSSPDGLAALVAAASGDSTGEDVAWDVLQTLLPDLDPAAVLNLLGHGMSEHMAGILAATVIKRTGTDVTLFEKALTLSGEPDVPAAMAALRCLATLRTPEAVRVIEAAARWPDPLVRRATARILGRMPMTSSTPGALGRGLRDPDADVMNEALDAIRRQGEPALAPQLTRWLEEQAFRRLDEEQRIEVAALAAEIDPDHATRFFKGKLTMSVRAKVGGIMGTPEVVAWNALAAHGLAAAATEEAIEKLRSVRTKGDENFRQLVSRLAVEARHKAGS